MVKRIVDFIIDNVVVVINMLVIEVVDCMVFSEGSVVSLC